MIFCLSYGVLFQQKEEINQVDKKAPKILIVDDEGNIHYSFKKIFSPEFSIISALSAEEGLEKMASVQPDVVVMDVRLPGIDGLSALKKLREVDARTPVIMMTAFGTMTTAIQAMKFGAYEYLLKPFDVKKMREVIRKAYESGKMMRRSVSVKTNGQEGATKEGDVIVGISEAMQEVYKLIGQVAAQDVTVLIRGESGTGKELVARALYQHSMRSKQPFLVINCAALPDNLLESELFGYEKGAFTGASERRVGKFEQVSGGTLFLDEIGEMSLLTQAKILRVIQYGEFTRMGGNNVVKTNVRLLAATNRNLEEMIEKGAFREDLYYRLNIITIDLPNLIQRKEDIPELVNYFINRYSKETGKNIQGIDKKALEALLSYNWPGNVRQLENCIRRAMVLAKGMRIVPEDLELKTDEKTDINALEEDSFAALERIVEQIMNDESKIKLWPLMEKILIEKTLKKTNGNQLQAARVLGIHRNTLKNRIEKYDLTHLI